MRFCRSIFFVAGFILLTRGDISAQQKSSALKSNGSLALNFSKSAAVANQGFDTAGLVAKAVQSGEDSLEAMRTLTCRQRVDVYEHGKFRESSEFDVDFHNGSEHYSNLLRAGHPRGISFGGEIALMNLFEYFGQPSSFGEYARFLQDALDRMKAPSNNWEMGMAQPGELVTICIDVRHPRPDFWEFDGKYYYDVPYRLTVYIDPATAKIRRIVQARPASYGLPTNLWYVDYGFETINGKRYWIPLSGGYESAGRDRDLFSNKIRFEEYREFTVGFTILFPR